MKTQADIQRRAYPLSLIFRGGAKYYLPLEKREEFAKKPLGSTHPKGEEAKKIFEILTKDQHFSPADAGRMVRGDRVEEWEVIWGEMLQVERDRHPEGCWCQERGGHEDCRYPAQEKDLLLDGDGEPLPDCPFQGDCLAPRYEEGWYLWGEGLIIAL